MKGQLHRELLQHFESTTDITVASMTMEIVGFHHCKAIAINSPEKVAKKTSASTLAKVARALGHAEGMTK